MITWIRDTQFLTLWKPGKSPLTFTWFSADLCANCGCYSELCINWGVAALSQGLGVIYLLLLHTHSSPMLNICLYPLGNPLVTPPFGLDARQTSSPTFWKLVWNGSTENWLRSSKDSSSQLSNLSDFSRKSSYSCLVVQPFSKWPASAAAAAATAGGKCLCPSYNGQFHKFVISTKPNTVIPLCSTSIIICTHKLKWAQKVYGSFRHFDDVLRTRRFICHNYSGVFQ